MRNVLIIYFGSQYPLRKAIWDHLYSFRSDPGCNCIYINAAVRRIPRWIGKMKFDAIIFHTTLLAQRWHPAAFERILERLRGLGRIDCPKVALPQDEFINTDLLCRFIGELGIGFVFSVAPESEWRKIYGDVLDRVSIHRVLTGYLDDSTVKKIDLMGAEIRERTVDIGYRAWKAEPWLGRHGRLKITIADVFAAKGLENGLTIDISTDEKDTLLGDDWYRFLLRCKYMIGVEGGASILDKDGTLRTRTNAYVKDHPGASFEDVEAACFPNRDGEFGLLAISPRHLESCATRTCQVLVEGEYNGILLPGRHYIELKKDFRNLDEVMAVIKSDEQREAMTARAYEEIVESGKYSYAGFAGFVLEKVAGGRCSEASAGDGFGPFPVRADLVDRLSWAAVVVRYGLLNLVRRFVSGLLPKAMKTRLERMIKIYVEGRP